MAKMVWTRLRKVAGSRQSVHTNRATFLKPYSSFHRLHRAPFSGDGSVGLSQARGGGMD